MAVIAVCCARGLGLAATTDSLEFLSARVAQALAHDDMATASRLLGQGLSVAPNHPTLLAQRAQLVERERRGVSVGREESWFVSPARQVAAVANPPAQNTDLRLRQAQALVSQGRLASAANVYRAVLRSAPNDLGARTALGYTHFWRGNWREALNEFATVINADPRNLPARLGYLRALHAAGRASSAYQQATQLDRSVSQDAELGLLLANIVAAVDADDEAQSYLSRPSNDLDVQRRQNAFYAQRLIARGHREEGLARVSLWLQAKPRDYDAFTDLAEAHINAGQAAKARSFYEQAAALNPQRPEAGLGLARVAFLGGRHAESLRLYQQVADVNPESLDALLGVSRLAQINGDKSRAWQAINTAAKLAPGSAHVHEAATKLAFQLDDRATFQTAVSAWANDQPTDVRPEVWAQKWNATHGLKPDLQVLNACLDPLAPETSSEALKIIRQYSAEPRANAINRVPPAPTPELTTAAQAKLSQQITLLQSGRVGLATGFELSSLRDTSGAGVALPGWNEQYVAAFWGQPLGHTLSVDLRRYERFGLTAWSAVRVVAVRLIALLPRRAARSAG